jgi:hypothetical protein
MKLNSFTVHEHHQRLLQRINLPDRHFIAFDAFLEWAADTHNVSFAGPGQPRPADFSSTAGDGRTVTSWRRLKRKG